MGAVGRETPDIRHEHWLGGVSVRLVLDADRTGDRFVIVEHRLGPRELMAPMHRHTHEDAYTIVVEGSVGFVLGEDTHIAGVGEVIQKPRDQWHTFFNAGDTPARVLEIISPPGLERYFAELVLYFPADGSPDLEGMADASERYGLDMDFDSLAPLVERHSLASPPEMGT